MTTTTPNMGLVKPDVLSTPAPTWASLLNSVFDAIDSHDHSSGEGVKITPSGMNISSDLSIGSNNLTSIRTTRFNNLSSWSPTASDLACFYVLNNEIYFRDGVGNNVKITNNGSLNISISSLIVTDLNLVIQNASDNTKQFLFSAAAISTGTTRTYTMPNANVTLVGDTNSQGVSNKTFTGNDFDGGTASNTSRITTPKAPLSTLQGLTRKEGTILFASDNKRLFVDNGTSLTSVGGATGGGSDAIFYENGKTVTTNYTITAGSNAMSTGPVTVNSGVTVTIPSGSRWVIL
ncbi:MAG: hypothetical protein ACK40T_11685 [Akkermansiaceae bacterium]|jgi:hypothetical protein